MSCGITTTNSCAEPVLLAQEGGVSGMVLVRGCGFHLSQSTRVFPQPARVLLLCEMTFVRACHHVLSL